MKVLFRWIKEKISGIWTKAVVPHARICMISGAVVAVAGASAITAVEYINYNNKTQIQAKETEAEMQEETQTHNNVEQTKPVVMETETETQEQTPAETESTTQEEISELVMAAVTDENTSSREIYEIIDKAASDSDIVIPVKDVEDIDIVEDNSSEPSKDETEVEVGKYVVVDGTGFKLTTVAEDPNKTAVTHGFVGYIYKQWPNGEYAVFVKRNAAVEA